MKSAKDVGSRKLEVRAARTENTYEKRPREVLRMMQPSQSIFVLKALQVTGSRTSASAGKAKADTRNMTKVRRAPI